MIFCRGYYNGSKQWKKCEHGFWHCKTVFVYYDCLHPYKCSAEYYVSLDQNCSSTVFPPVRLFLVSENQLHKSLWAHRYINHIFEKKSDAVLILVCYTVSNYTSLWSMVFRKKHGSRLNADGKELFLFWTVSSRLVFNGAYDWGSYSLLSLTLHV